MKKINMEKHYAPDTKEINKITSVICPKKERFFKVGTIFGICVVIASIVGFITLLATKISIYSSLWFIPEVSIVCGICSIIGGIRSKKEGDLYDQGEFKIRRGYVKQVEKRNSWSDKVTIKYSEKDEETFSQIGHNLKQNDKVYISVVNQEKAPWVLPRITKR